MVGRRAKNTTEKRSHQKPNQTHDPKPKGQQSNQKPNPKPKTRNQDRTTSVVHGEREPTRWFSIRKKRLSDGTAILGMCISPISPCHRVNVDLKGFLLVATPPKTAVLGGSRQRFGWFFRGKNTLLCLFFWSKDSPLSLGGFAPDVWFFPFLCGFGWPSFLVSFGVVGSIPFPKGDGESCE